MGLSQPVAGQRWKTEIDALEIPVPDLHFGKKQRGKLHTSSICIAHADPQHMALLLKLILKFRIGKFWRAGQLCSRLPVCSDAESDEDACRPVLAPMEKFEDLGTVWQLSSLFLPKDSMSFLHNSTQLSTKELISKAFNKLFNNGLYDS
jgi:hypothetical protein